MTEIASTRGKFPQHQLQTSMTSYSNYNSMTILLLDGRDECKLFTCSGE